MGSKYTDISGLSFPKGSDREYIEEWSEGSKDILTRKTVNGDVLVNQENKTILTIKGKGDCLPKCELAIGDIVNVRGNTFVFEKWNYTYEPWAFSYSWSYSFVQIKDAA